MTGYGFRFAGVLLTVGLTAGVANGAGSVARGKPTTIPPDLMKTLEIAVGKSAGMRWPAKLLQLRQVTQPGNTYGACGFVKTKNGEVPFIATYLKKPKPDHWWADIGKTDTYIFATQKTCAAMGAELPGWKEMTKPKSGTGSGGNVSLTEVQKNAVSRDLAAKKQLWGPVSGLTARLGPDNLIWACGFSKGLRGNLPFMGVFDRVRDEKKTRFRPAAVGGTETKNWAVFDICKSKGITMPGAL